MVKSCLLYRITKTYLKLFAVNLRLLFAANPYRYNELMMQSDRIDYELTQLLRKLC